MDERDTDPDHDRDHDADDDAATPATLDAAALERAAVEYLARYAASRRGVERVLARRIDKVARRGGVDVEAARAAARQALDRLAAQGLLDDGRFAEGRARSLLARGRPVAAIRAALREKGVDAAQAEDAIAALTHETPAPDLAAALALARRRRLGPYRSAETRAARRDKDLGVMARAGFAREIACRIVDAPDLDALERLAAGAED